MTGVACRVFPAVLGHRVDHVARDGRGVDRGGGLDDHSCAWVFVLIAMSSPAPGEVVVA
jgi:hypothetical protein